MAMKGETLKRLLRNLRVMLNSPSCVPLYSEGRHDT